MRDAIALGDCYEAAVELMLDLARDGTADEATLVHGLVTGNGGMVVGIRYRHAWVEIGDEVFDYSNGRRYVARRFHYYRLGRVREEDNFRYSWEEVRKNLVTDGTYGPWHEGREEEAERETLEWLRLNGAAA